VKALEMSDAVDERQLCSAYHSLYQMASEELAVVTKPQEQKQRHFFLPPSLCERVRNRAEERRLTDEGTGMFFLYACPHWFGETTNVLHIQ
jgi:hypothetical protein